MSIVTFDGQVLAADSRKTTRRMNPKTGEREFVKSTDEQVKIELIEKNRLFRGEQIEAVGRCGNLKLSSAIIAKIHRGGSLENYWTPKRVAEYSRPASVLIVTDRNSYHFRASPSKGVVITELERKPFAMGAGAEVAMFLMDTLKLPACEAAMAVTLKFRSCGGPIQLLKRDRWTGRLMAVAPKCTTVNGNERRVLVAEAFLKAATRMKTRAERALVQSECPDGLDPERLLKTLFGTANAKKPTKKKV